MKYYCNNFTINEILEILDHQILYVLDRAKRNVKGPSRGVQFFQKKAEVRAAVLYSTGRRNIEKG